MTSADRIFLAECASCLADSSAMKDAEVAQDAPARSGEECHQITFHLDWILMLGQAESS